MAEPHRSVIELVIFDCDGVLVDTEPVANRVLARELSALGWKVDAEEACRMFVGLSMRSCVGRIERRLGLRLPEGWVDRLQARTFDAFRRAGLRSIPGVERALDRLSVPFCVASSGTREKMRLTLALTGLLERFEGRMFSATEVRRGKPHPDLFLLAARRMRADPARCVVVEDSVPGIRAARAAGMLAFGYAPRGDGTVLEASGARPLRDMAELPRRLEEIDPRLAAEAGPHPAAASSLSERARNLEDGSGEGDR